MHISLTHIIFLSESKQSIISLGFPEVIATIFYEEYGKNAFTIAKWCKEYSSVTSDVSDKLWWKKTKQGYSLGMGLLDYINFFQAAKKSLVDYNKIRVENEFRELKPEEFDKADALLMLKQEIKAIFFDDIFFYRNLIKDFTTGKIKDLKPYESLSFSEANEKYEEKTIFQDKKPIVSYKNGWRWIDAGAKCDIVGNKMRNCGSTGVMSLDPGKTMMALFDEHNNPHVVVTYSPNENRISGVEGQASTAIKNEYAEYVLDLTKILKANFDYDKSNSKFLKLKYLLATKIKSIKQILTKDSSVYDELFQFVTNNNETYYTNGYEIISKDDFDKIDFYILDRPPKNLTDKLKGVFNYYEKPKIIENTPGIKFVSVYEFAKIP